MLYLFDTNIASAVMAGDDGILSRLLRLPVGDDVAIAVSAQKSFRQVPGLATEDWTT